MLKLYVPDITAVGEHDVSIQIGDIAITITGHFAAYLGRASSEHLFGIARDAAIAIMNRLNSLEQSVMQEPIQEAKPAASRKQRRTK